MTTKESTITALQKRFRIALSFPGEHRAFVEHVAAHLAASVQQERVLYDKYWEAEFARIDLDSYLQHLYHEQSELIAVFLCADYERKEWCGLEWRAIRDVIKRRQASAVMPLRFDNTEIPGLFSTDGYVWIGTRTPDEVAKLILERLRINAESTVVISTWPRNAGLGDSDKSACPVAGNNKSNQNAQHATAAESGTTLAARAFLSYSHCDAAAARLLKTQLESKGVSTWAYESDLPFSGAMSAEVEHRIRGADFFLLLLSEPARSCQRVRRELGLAAELQRHSEARPPVIVGVTCPSSRHVADFELLDYATGRPTGLTYDFASCRRFDLARDTVDQFADFLRPVVTYITTASEEHQSLLRRSFDCYVELFPDPAERDDPECIQDWLDEARRAEAMGSPWREVYGVLSVAGQVIGIAFLSLHVLRNWSFGSYFGVRRGWRELQRAEFFLEHVSNHVRALAPALKGILFEVEPLDFDLLKQAECQTTLRTIPDQTKFFESLRALRRIRLYETYHCVSLLQADGKPLPYWQPAMEEPLDPTGERQLNLMVLPLAAQPFGVVEVTEIVRFIYDDVFGDAYGSLGTAVIPGYRTYVAGIRDRVMSHVHENGCKAGPLEVPRSTLQWLHRAKQEGMFDELAL